MHTASKPRCFVRCLLVLLALVATLSPAAPAAEKAGPKKRKPGKPTYHPRETRLSRDHAYQRQLYAWLKTTRIEQVRLAPAVLRWDGTQTAGMDLSEFWPTVVDGRMRIIPTAILRMEARWFLLDDGAGGGIEGSGKVKHPRWANNAVFWYGINLPLKDGGQGNPFYRNPAVARRALIATALDIMMLDKVHEYNSRVCRTDFLGGTMNAWAYTFATCKGILDRKTAAAFEAGLERMVDKFLRWKARDVNTNMDMRAVSAVAMLHSTTRSARIRDKCLRAARLILFGYEDGSLDKLDSLVGTFYPAGYIGENEGPETTYNGVSLYHLLEAKAAVKDDAAWSFLDDVLKPMIEFKLHQYFRDPDGNMTGPSGYSCRTGGTYVRDQHSRPWRDVAAAGMYPVALPLVRARMAQLAALTDADVTRRFVERIRGVLGRMSERGKLGAVDPAPPMNWKNDHRHHWPPGNPYFARRGWFRRLRKAYAKPGPPLVPPFERPAALSRQFGPKGKEEFWAFKNHDGKRDFGFFIEHVPRCWPYGSWAGGSLQVFWTRDAGILVMARHAKTGDEVHKQENTRVWEEIDQWATDHVWGRSTDRDLPVISSATAFHHIPAKVTSDLNALPPYVEAVTAFSCRKRYVPVAQLSLTSRFEAIHDGLRVTKTVRKKSPMKLTELWATIPVYLRDSRGQSKLADADIEYWDGQAWKKLGAKRVKTVKIRLSRDFGQGPRRGYIHFTAPQHVRLSGEIWQDNYQHGSQGKADALAGARSVIYEIRTNP